MKDRFESLESGEVISVQQDTPVLGGQRTFRVGELNDAIRKQLESAIEGWNEDKSAWFSPDGIDCEALRFGSKGWQRGRIRLCLEFCPDEPISATESVSTSFVPTTMATSPSSHVATLNAPSDSSDANRLTAVVEPTPATVLPETSESRPLAAATVATVAVGAAVLAATQQEVASIPTSDFVTTPPEVASVVTTHLTDVVLVAEDEQLEGSNDLHVEGLEEISFEFDGNNGDDRQGTLVPNGMMELDLTDLDLDRGEHDYLNFETTGLSDAVQGLADLPELSHSDNSGILIDEVWNEISQQPSWPGIH